MPPTVRLNDECTGHGCYPSRVNDQGSPNVFVNNRNAHRVGDHWVTHCCFDGSTKFFINNEFKTFEEVYNNSNLYINSKTITYDLDENCFIEISINKIIKAETTEMIELELDNGYIIKCTPDHEFLLIDGTYKEARELTDSDEIMEMNQ